jgi:transcriptional regulator with XRE-family HTH domain
MYRAVHRLTIRECADQIGLSPSSLNRFEQSDAGMSAEHFLKLSQWLLARTNLGTTTAIAPTIDS